MTTPGSLVDQVSNAGEHFELLRCGIAAIFAITWGSVLVFWKRQGMIGALA